MPINYQLNRLWGGSVPILTATNLLESGIVDRNFNKKLSNAAIGAFDTFTNTTSSTSNNQHDGGRRRRRQRTSAAAPLGNTENVSPPNNSDRSTQVASNDNFFEYQRTRGFRLSTPGISSCNEVKELEEIHVLDAVTQYLLQLDNKKSISIANQLQTDSIFTIDMWAAVQRGKNAYHEYHVHKGSILSGVYYSNCPDNCAPLILKRPNNKLDEQSANGGESYRDDNDDEEDVIIHPKEGKFVIFPPWLYHGVPKTNEEHTEQARVSFAFNLNGRIVDQWSITRPS